MSWSSQWSPSFWLSHQYPISLIYVAQYKWAYLSSWGYGCLDLLLCNFITTYSWKYKQHHSQSHNCDHCFCYQWD
jgi:hypothetical protein